MPDGCDCEVEATRFCFEVKESTWAFMFAEIMQCVKASTKIALVFFCATF